MPTLDEIIQRVASVGLGGVGFVVGKLRTTLHGKVFAIRADEVHATAQRLKRHIPPDQHPHGFVDPRSGTGYVVVDEPNGVERTLDACAITLFHETLHLLGLGEARTWAKTLRFIEAGGLWAAPGVERYVELRELLADLDEDDHELWYVANYLTNFYGDQVIWFGDRRDPDRRWRLYQLIREEKFARRPGT